MKILVLKFNTVILFGLNRLKGKKKVTSLYFYSHSFYVYLRGCIVYQNTAVGRTIHEPKYV